MSGPRINVLVTGYGNIGTPILKALTTSEYKDRIQAFVLIRPASLSDPQKQPAIDVVRALSGVTILEGDLDADVPALTALLKQAKIQTIVSVVGGAQIGKQLPLIEAAKAAGVRHFLPSEFGVDTELLPIAGTLTPMLQGKKGVQQAVKAAGLDQTLVFVGGFSEFLVNSPFFGVDLQRGVIEAPASLDAKISTTPVEEIGWLVAAAVVEPQARNASLYSGEPVSFKQVADLVDAARGKPLERRVRTVEEAQKAIDKNPYDFSARFVSAVADGKGCWWPVSQTYAAKFHPEHTPYALTDWIKANVKPAAL